jgi:hypothetical protein
MSCPRGVQQKKPGGGRKETTQKSQRMRTSRMKRSHEGTFFYRCIISSRLVQSKLEVFQRTRGRLATPLNRDTRRVKKESWSRKVKQLEKIEGNCLSKKMWSWERILREETGSLENASVTEVQGHWHWSTVLVLPCNNHLSSLLPHKLSRSSSPEYPINKWTWFQERNSLKKDVNNLFNLPRKTYEKWGYHLVLCWAPRCLSCRHWGKGQSIPFIGALFNPTSQQWFWHRAIYILTAQVHLVIFSRVAHCTAIVCQLLSHGGTSGIESSCLCIKHWWVQKWYQLWRFCSLMYLKDKVNKITWL